MLTVMLGAVVELVAGVNVAVRVKPLPVIGPNVPPVTVTSLVSKPVGASLNANVIVAVSPIFSAVLSLVIATVGATVSMVMLGVVPATPALPATSV